MAKKYQHALPVGGRIENYEIISVLGKGGFGITYRARDNELQTDVAIKEYFPAEIAARARDDSTVQPHETDAKDYEYGLERFLDEARTLARFKEPNIVRVLRFFRANGTGYIVMDFEEGETFGEYLKDHKQPTEDQLKAIFIPVLDGLRAVHEQNYLHRDIKPGNIYIRSNGSPMLIDFGASRQALSEHSRSMTGIVTAGYAPFEQYGTRSKHQPSSDLYAIGATLYKAVTGHAPPDSPERVEAMHSDEPDPMVPAAEVASGRYSENFLRTIDWLLQPLARNRPQNTQDVIDCLLGKRPLPDEDEPTEIMHQQANDNPATQLMSNAGGSGSYRSSPEPVSGQSSVYSGGAGGGASATAGNSRKGLWIGLAALLLLAGGGVATWLLLPVYGSLSIVSVPAGSEWYLDGTLQGKTPGTAKELKPGKHLVAIRRAGYKPWQQTVTIEKDTLLPVQATLEELFYRLTIRTTPSRSSIRFVDSKQRYRPGMKLKPGHYRVKVSAYGYEPVTQTVEVKDGDTTIDITLQKGTWPLTVRTRPSNATVEFSDGSRSFSQGMKLPAGTYRLRVSAPGYQTRIYIVRISGSARNINISLRREAAALSASQLYSRGVKAYTRSQWSDSLSWFIKAARKGHANAYAMIGRQLKDGRGIRRDYARALRFFKQADQRGSGMGAFYAGWIYENAKGVRRDYLRALGYYRKAASRRYTVAYNQIGWFYQKSLGVPRNYAAAARWYRRGASGGSLASMNNLAYLYYKGYGVSQSYSSARYWFEKAARRGNAISMDWLGGLYERGQGVRRSRSTAIYWYRKAARKGLSSAKASLRRLGVSY